MTINDQQNLMALALSVLKLKHSNCCCYCSDSNSKDDHHQQFKKKTGEAMTEPNNHSSPNHIHDDPHNFASKLSTFFLKDYQELIYPHLKLFKLAHDHYALNKDDDNYNNENIQLKVAYSKEEHWDHVDLEMALVSIKKVILLHFVAYEQNLLLLHQQEEKELNHDLRCFSFLEFLENVVKVILPCMTDIHHKSCQELTEFIHHLIDTGIDDDYKDSSQESKTVSKEILNLSFMNAQQSILKNNTLMYYPGTKKINEGHKRQRIFCLQFISIQLESIANLMKNWENNRYSLTKKHQTIENLDWLIHLYPIDSTMNIYRPLNLINTPVQKATCVAVDELDDVDMVLKNVQSLCLQILNHVIRISEIYPDLHDFCRLVYCFSKRILNLNPI